MKRALLDEGLPPAAASLLREEGWNAVHVRDLGLASASDEDILALASSQDRVAVTLDRDFPQILALTASTRPSVVLVRIQGLKAAGVAELLKRVWRDHEEALSQGCLVLVSQRGARVRPLPIK